MKVCGLKLEKVKLFKSLNLDFRNPEDGTPLKNIILVGANGSGKTTILRSIVHSLTMINSVYGGEKFDETDINVKSKEKELQIELDLEYNQREEKILYDGVDNSDEYNYKKIATIKVLEDINADTMNGNTGRITPDNKVYKDYILCDDDNRDKYINFMMNFGSENNTENLAFYFDSIRFLPKKVLVGPNSIELPKEKKFNMLNNSIYDGNNEITDKYLYVKQWLINLDYKRFKVRKYEKTYKSVIEAINMLVSPNKFIKIEEDGDILFETKGGSISIDKLSDGFKNIFVIIGELLYRFESMSENINDVFNKEAIVMIDEIDCHLHPEWQLNLIPTLNKLFPNIQIIATTHSPLIVRSVLPYECISLEELV